MRRITNTNICACHSEISSESVPSGSVTVELSERSNACLASGSLGSGKRGEKASDENGSDAGLGSNLFDMGSASFSASSSGEPSAC